MRFGLREIIFIVVLMVIPVGAWWFVFRPQNMHNAEMRRQIDARQAKLRQLNQVLGAIGDLERQIASLSQAIEYFQSKLPNEKEIDKILREIWLLAESNNLQAKSIRTLVRRGNTGFVSEDGTQAEQPIAVQLEGDFRGFYAFLLALENQPRIMRIGRMSLRSLGQTPDGHISADFELSIFFEKNGRAGSWLQRT